MKMPRLLLALGCAICSSLAHAQNTIYSYAVGNWRNGPVVEVSPLFNTTELFTDPQLMAWVRQQWPASFTDTTEMDVLRFATLEEATESSTTLKAKYAARKLAVHQVEAGVMPSTPTKPEAATGAPR